MGLNIKIILDSLQSIHQKRVYPFKGGTRPICILTFGEALPSNLYLLVGAVYWSPKLNKAFWGVWVLTYSWWCHQNLGAQHSLQCIYFLVWVSPQFVEVGAVNLHCIYYLVKYNDPGSQQYFRFNVAPHEYQAKQLMTNPVDDSKQKKSNTLLSSPFFIILGLKVNWALTLCQSQ